MELATLITGIFTLVAAIYFGRKQTKISEKNKEAEERKYNQSEDRRNREIYASATKFIQKYSKNERSHKAEILLLPYCVAAYKYNPSFLYRREIYRDFCSLTEEVQNEILKREGIELESKRADDYFTEALNVIRQNISMRYQNDNIANRFLYDNGKFLESSIINNNDKEKPDLTKTPILENSTSNLREYILDLLANHKNETPLSNIFPYFEGTDETLPEAICCLIAKCTVMYNYEDYVSINKNLPEFNFGCPDDYQGKRYMEDLFLETLHIIENYNILNGDK